jgi:hypothetical protein
LNMLTKRWLSWFILTLVVICLNINNGVSSSVVRLPAGANYHPEPEPPGLSENDYIPARRLRSKNNEGIIVDQRRLRINDVIPQPDPPARRLPELNDEMSVPEAPERRPRERVNANKTDDNNAIPSIIFFRRLREETDDVIGPEFKGRRLGKNDDGFNTQPDPPARRLRSIDDNDAVGPEFIQRRLNKEQKDAFPPQSEPGRRLNEETSNGIIMEEDIIVQDKQSLSRRLQKKMKQQRQNQTSLPPIDLPIETLMDSNDNSSPMTTDDENDVPMTTNRDMDDEEHEKKNNNNHNNTRQPRPIPRNRKLIN